MTALTTIKVTAADGHAGELRITTSRWPVMQKDVMMFAEFMHRYGSMNVPMDLEITGPQTEDDYNRLRNYIFRVYLDL